MEKLSQKDCKRIVEELGGCWHEWDLVKASASGRDFICINFDCGEERFLLSHERLLTPTFDNAIDLMWLLERLWEWKKVVKFLRWLWKKHYYGESTYDYLVVPLVLLKTPSALANALAEFLRERGEEG